MLGTDDPAEVQTCLSDWDKFDEVAAKAAEKGYKMLSGYDDSYRTFSNNVSAPWVDGTTVKVDPNIMKWVEQTKDYTDKGYNNKSILWRKSATASSAITRFAKARSPITGAAPGCAPRPARITPRPSRTAC